MAKALNVTPQAVQQWKKVPPERVLEVENITGVTRYELRPDVFGDPPPKSKAVGGNGVRDGEAKSEATA